MRPPKALCYSTDVHFPTSSMTFLVLPPKRRVAGIITPRTEEKEIFHAHTGMNTTILSYVRPHA